MEAIKPSPLYGVRITLKGQLDTSLTPWSFGDGWRYSFPVFFHSPKLKLISSLTLAASSWMVIISSDVHSQAEFLFHSLCLGRENTGRSLHISPTPVTSHLILNIDLEMKAAIVRNPHQWRGKYTGLSSIVKFSDISYITLQMKAFEPFCYQPEVLNYSEAIY